jgi:hypothetical protein
VPPRTAPSADSRRLASRAGFRPSTQASAHGSAANRSELSTALSSLSSWDGKYESIKDVLDTALGHQAAADGAGEDVEKFRSIAVYSNMKLAEMFKDGQSVTDHLGRAKPSVAHTAICAHILEEIASVPSAFHDVLAQIKDPLLMSMYSDQLMSGSIDTCERVPYYEIVDRLRAEQHRWAQQNQDLLQQFEDMDNGRRSEAQGVLALQVRCAELETEVSKWKARHAEQTQNVHFLERKCVGMEESDASFRDISMRDPETDISSMKEGDDEETATRKKLHKAMAQYKRASVEVEQFRYQMRYMVPRKELEDMKVERNRLEAELHDKTTAYRVLTLKYNKAFDNLNRLRKQESTRTPRPDWNTCRDLVDGAMDLDFASQPSAEIAPQICQKLGQMTKLLEQRAESGDALNKIRSVLDGTDDNAELLGSLMDSTYGKYTLQEDEDNNPGFFIGHGIDLMVPRFLRWEGSVRNRKFKKGDISKLIDTFWTTKATFDEVKKQGGKDTMSEFMYIHFMKLYGKAASTVVEWTYSILDALERYEGGTVGRELENAEPHFRLFKHVLLEEVGEEVYYDEQEMLTTLTAEIKIISECVKAKSGGKKKEVFHCSLETFMQMIRKFFPVKKQEFFTRLAQMMVKIAEENGDKIFLHVLHGDGRNLGKTDFLKMLKIQYIQEIAGVWIRNLFYGPAEGLYARRYY